MKKKKTGNITGRHSLRASGLTHAVAIDVAPLVKPKKGVQGALIRVKSTNQGKDRKPAKQWQSYRTKGTVRRQRFLVKKIVSAAGRDKTQVKLAQLRLMKVLRASYRKKLSRATGKAHKRHALTQKKSKK